MTLKFAELYWTSAGKRVFNVSLEGSQVIGNLDIWSKVGQNAAYQEVQQTNVSDGELTIAFREVTNNAKVSAKVVKSSVAILPKIGAK